VRRADNVPDCDGVAVLQSGPEAVTAAADATSLVLFGDVRLALVTDVAMGDCDGESGCSHGFILHAFKTVCLSTVSPSFSR